MRTTNQIFIYAFIALLVIVLVQSRTSLVRRTIANFAHTYSSDEEEWWVEVEITPKAGTQEENDDILLLLYDDFLAHKRQKIESWHFFREPTLRFRIEFVSKEDRDSTAAELKNFLDSIELIAEHYFARHGERIESFDEGYAGEYDQYRRMWPYQRKLWEWGSEMTVESIKESKEIGGNDPSREHQLERIFHLLSNQLLPGYEENKRKEYFYLGLFYGASLGVLASLVVVVAFKFLSKRKIVARTQSANLDHFLKCSDD